MSKMTSVERAMLRVEIAKLDAYITAMKTFFGEGRHDLSEQRAILLIQRDHLSIAYKLREWPAGH